MKLKDILKRGTGFSTTACSYDAVIHLKSGVLDLSLLLEGPGYCNNTGGKTVGEKKEGGRNLRPYRMLSWKIIITVRNTQKRK